MYNNNTDAQCLLAMNGDPDAIETPHTQQNSDTSSYSSRQHIYSCWMYVIKRMPSSNSFNRAHPSPFETESY